MRRSRHRIQQTAPAIHRQHLAGQEGRRIRRQILHRLDQFGGRGDAAQGRAGLDRAAPVGSPFSAACRLPDITDPKATALTRMPLGASATASDRVIWSTAAQAME
jgi:hypothetical protein